MQRPRRAFWDGWIRGCEACRHPAVEPVVLRQPTTGAAHPVRQAWAWDWMMTSMTTEAALRDWRYGQTQAERLCAGLLSIEGFTAVDPQHPLGGPDGIKDVLCRRGITSYVAAAYLPTTPPNFTEIKNKFKNDLPGVIQNTAQGFLSS